MACLRRQARGKLTSPCALHHGSRCANHQKQIAKPFRDARVTARNTNHNDNVWTVVEPHDPCTLVSCVSSKKHPSPLPSTNSPVHDARDWLGFKIPYSELLTYTHTDTRSRTSDVHNYLQSTRGATAATICSKRRGSSAGSHTSQPCKNFSCDAPSFRARSFANLVHSCFHSLQASVVTDLSLRRSTFSPH